MDQVHVVRYKVLVEGLSVRQVARQLGISRNTVKRYLGLLSEPVRTEDAPRPKPVLEKVGPKIEAILEDAPRWTGGKQRLTATQLHKMLHTDGVEVGVTLVKEVVAEWRRRRREVFVPLVYHPGDLGEMDFFEVLVDVAGQRQKAWMFVMRLMHSGRDFSWVYTRQDQVSFLDGHVRAFAHFGAVPHRIAYDNLKPAVRKILVGSERKLTGRFEALASHYLFEPCFCRPATGHDKGGVEARGKGIRWQHLVPIPSGEDLGVVSAALITRLDQRLNEGRDADGRTIGDRFAVEHGRMLPLSEHAFRARAPHSAGVSRRSLITVEGAVYSVPCEWAGRDVMAYVGPGDVEIAGPTGIAPTGTVIHPRKRFGERSIDYRHYLRELARKPQAVRQVAAELIHDLGAPFDTAWRLLVDAHGPKQAARILAKVLGYVETRGLGDVARTLQGALERDEPLLLALAPAAPSPTLVAQEALPQSLRMVEVASGCAADYDGWVGGGAT
jgi:transposase